MQEIKSELNGVIIETFIGRLTNQCVTRTYNKSDADSDGWINPSKVKIIDKINLRNHCIYESGIFLQNRHNEIITQLSIQQI